MLSQFSKEGEHATLADLQSFPKDVYPVGRLDADSEGLLLITNDKRLNTKMLDPKFKHERTYVAQVEGDVDNESIIKLCKGTEITVNGKKYFTLPAKAIKVDEPFLPERNPPIRFRKNIPTSWIQLTLIEGKNRQVRKMTASVGFPTLRLVRVQIGKLTLNNMKSGEVREFDEKEIYQLLGINLKK